MANLTEKNEWTDGIYQIEKTDPVVGGVEGISNRQAQQLANRTKYLKEQVESLNSGKAESSHTHTIAQVTDLQNTLNSKATNTDLTNAKNSLTTEINKKATKDAFSALHDLMVGIPFPYPLSTVPSGCLAMNGQKFYTSTYPILAKKYPNGVLPDLRGEFIRGWDNGSGVDSGRALLSSQGDAIRNLEGRISGIVTQFGGVLNATGVFKTDPTKFDNIFGSSTKVSDYGDYLGFDASLVVPTASENRPRNIAFHYICLAA
ncbi:tail fiber protein [Lonepinella sp. BR2919]|uniref:tail fiber protein n=1 Tax=unclassified Lonepinella TaxID=2642006 RepID=UPI003F6DC9C5